MNNTQKKINWIRVLRPIALALALLFLLSYATYAWLKRDWKPKIHQENIKIVAGSSLTFIFDNEKIDDISVNELLDKREFTFKSVSNCSGESEDFFGLNYSPSGQYYDKFKKLSVSDLDTELQKLDTKYTELGYKYGYLEFTFHVASISDGEVYDKNIYLSGSYVNGVVVDGDEATTERNASAAKAVRISVTVYGDDGKPQQTKIFAKEATTHTGITDDYIDGYGYVANGADRYDRSTDPYSLAQYAVFEYNGVQHTDDYNLRKSTTAKTFDALENEPLFVLENGTQRTVTVRIWLEGEDENCTDSIADSALDLLLQFSAKDIRK